MVGVPRPAVKSGKELRADFKCNILHGVPRNRGTVVADFRQHPTPDNIHRKYRLTRNKTVLAWRLLRELRILWRACIGGRSCLLSKLVLFLGISYLFLPIDLIPDRLPAIGHFDELGLLLLGFAGSRRLVPVSVVEQFYSDSDVDLEPPLCPGQWQCIQFAVRVIRADLANFFLSAVSRCRRLPDHRQEFRHSLAEIHAELRDCRGVSRSAAATFKRHGRR